MIVCKHIILYFRHSKSHLKLLSKNFDQKDLGMPELPEVETVRRYLQSVLLKPKAKKIKQVNVYYAKIVRDI